MRPPICALCRRDFRGDSGSGGLVHFRDQATMPDGMVGHPDGVEWFCRRHLAAAEALSSSSLADAMAALRRRYRWRLTVGALCRAIWRAMRPRT